MASSMFNLSGALSDPHAVPVPYWENFDRYLNPVANQWRRSFRDQNELYDMAREGILGNTAAARQNAQTYNDYIKGLFGQPQNNFNQYSQIGDYLYGKLGSFTDTLKDAGLKDMNMRLAAQGITPGTTGYDRLLNATRITSNMLPAFNNTTNAIGRDFNTMANDSYRNMLVRLGLAQNDVLTQNLDRPYTRYLDLADERQNQMLGRANMLNALGAAARGNVAGFKIEEDSDWAKAIGVVDNLLNGAVDIYGSMYGGGMGGGMGGMGGGMGGGGGGIGSYNSPALGGQSGNGPNNFMLGNMGNAAGGGGGNNNMAGIMQMIMQMMQQRQQAPTYGSIPGGAYSGYDNEAGLGYY